VKQQYFGDAKDYHKYGLLRALQEDGDLRLLVAWMLTEDKGGKDGSDRSYLSAAQSSCRECDPVLWDFLRDALAAGERPGVALVEASGLLPRASFYSARVPDDAAGRHVWRAGLLAAARDADLVFLDPDKGLEVPSKPMGRKDSNQYVAWDEVASLAAAGASLIIYQHLPRIPRDQVSMKKGAELRRRTGATFVGGAHAPDVVFLVAGQPQHEQALRRGLERAGRRWHPSSRHRCWLKPFVLGRQ